MNLRTIMQPLFLPPIYRVAEGRGHLLEYPFGVVFVASGTDDLDEPTFRDLATAQRSLGVQAEHCVRVVDGPQRRFRIVDGEGFQSAWLHSYGATVVAIERALWQYRLTHRLSPPPVDLLIEYVRASTTEQPKAVSDLAKRKDKVFAFPDRDDGAPDYLILLPGSSVALWTTGAWKEQWWGESNIMLHFYGVSGWPSSVAPEDSPLPAYSIVRRDDDAVVSDGYHSLLHAARVSQWLYDETHIEVTVRGPEDRYNFEANLNIGDVVELSEDHLRGFDVELTERGGRLKLLERAGTAHRSREGLRDGGRS